jgi:hypothetical protein
VQRFQIVRFDIVRLDDKVFSGHKIYVESSTNP